METFRREGEYDGHRLLSPASVHAMTTNQIPGIGAQVFQNWLPEGSWAFGFMVQANVRLPFVGSLQPVGSFYHTGLGTSAMWCDPSNELLGVFMSTDLTFDVEAWENDVDFDLFQNLVTSALDD